jgi:hypothetical protein
MKGNRKGGATNAAPNRKYHHQYRVVSKTAKHAQGPYRLPSVFGGRADAIEVAFLDDATWFEQNPGENLRIRELVPEDGASPAVMKTVCVGKSRSGTRGYMYRGNLAVNLKGARRDH